MSRLLRLILLFAIITLIGGGLLPAERAQAQPGVYVSPRGMMLNYFNAINTRNYAAAYSQWLYPFQTYQAFVSGYADTNTVVGYFGGFQPSAAFSFDGGLPSVLLGMRTNGTTVAYTGCYYLSYTGGVTPETTWKISTANIRPLAAVPSSQDINTLLATRCYPRYSTSGYDVAQQIITDYYDAINRSDFLTAYNLWTTPIQSYADFVAGFSDTSDVVAFYGSYQFSGNYNSNDTGRIPVVLFGYHKDGGLAAYTGCFILGYSATRTYGWSISGARLSALNFVGVLPDQATILNALRTPCYP